MKRKWIYIIGCIAIVMLWAYAKSGHINLPGHGNRENKNLEEAVVRHASSLLADGGMVEFVSKYLCEDADGTKEKHTAHIVCNEDKDRIIEWKDITDK